MFHSCKIGFESSVTPRCEGFQQNIRDALKLYEHVTDVMMQYAAHPADSRSFISVIVLQ